MNVIDGQGIRRDESVQLVSVTILDVTQGTLQCRVCREQKPRTIEYWPPLKSARDGLDSWCRMCKTAYHAGWRKNNPEKVRRSLDKQLAARRTTEGRESQYRTVLTRRYGITLDDYRTLSASQGDVCGICQKPAAGILQVDHCHTSGRVRGLLCEKCNKLLGLTGDRPDVLRRAARYVRNSTPR